MNSLLISKLIELTISHERFSIKKSYDDNVKNTIFGAVKIDNLIIYWKFDKLKNCGELGMYINNKTSNIVYFNMPRHTYKVFNDRLINSNEHFDKFLEIFKKLEK